MTALFLSVQLWGARIQKTYQLEGRGWGRGVREILVFARKGWGGSKFFFSVISGLPPPPSMTPPLDVCLYDTNLNYEFYCTRGGWMRSISHESEFHTCFFFLFFDAFILLDWKFYMDDFFAIDLCMYRITLTKLRTGWRPSLPRTAIITLYVYIYIVHSIYICNYLESSMQQFPEVIFMQVAIIFFILEGVCFP